MAVAPNDITGPWEGEWRSNKNGHHGRLRCIVTKQSESECAAHFNAVYWKIFRFSYVVHLQGQSTNDVFQFRGKESLGGSIYEYEGTATPGQFNSMYRSSSDHGRFKMGRLPHEALYK